MSFHATVSSSVIILNIPKPFHHVYTVCRYQIMHILYKFIHTHIQVDTVHVHVHVG